VIVPVSAVADLLRERHYLGAARRGIAWSDVDGAIVLAHPTSRSLPSDGTWLELSRWCLLGRPNAGSEQWATLRAWLLAHRPEVTTIVSYSDPSVGHTGALYRACNWGWAPTWHRLRPPPTGNGRWPAGGKIESVKDRWICPLRPDPRREGLLIARDASILRRWPWARWAEPRFRRGVAVQGTGGADHRAWLLLQTATAVVVQR